MRKTAPPGMVAYVSAALAMTVSAAYLFTHDPVLALALLSAVVFLGVGNTVLDAWQRRGKATVTVAIPRAAADAQNYQLRQAAVRAARREAVSA